MSESVVNDAFTEFAAQPDEALSLSRGALLIASTFDETVDVEHEMGLLASLARGVADRVPLDNPLGAVNVLNEYLFDEIGFAGNDADYYDPRNSLLHEVLRRRLGIPITLSVVYIEVGARSGVPFTGVGMPGHFLVRPVDELTLFVDPFHGGVVLSEEECRARFEELSPSGRWDLSYLNPVGTRSILVRMLRNLAAICVQREALTQAASSLDMLVALQPNEPGHLRDRGFLRHRMGMPAAALRDLDSYLGQASSAPDRWHVLRLADQLRRRA